VNSSLSSWSEVINSELGGVPQGLVLGPRIFINDLPSLMRNKVISFAKIYSNIVMLTQYPPYRMT